MRPRLKSRGDPIIRAACSVSADPLHDPLARYESGPERRSRREAQRWLPCDHGRGTVGRRGTGLRSPFASGVMLAVRVVWADSPTSAIDGSDADIFDRTDRSTFARSAKEGRRWQSCASAGFGGVGAPPRPGADHRSRGVRVVSPNDRSGWMCNLGRNSSPRHAFRGRRAGGTDWSDSADR